MDQKAWKKFNKFMVIFGLMITTGAVVFGLTFYYAMVEFDRNIAYMAMFHDDYAAELYSSGASYDAYTFASGAATAYCSLLGIEKRNLGYDKYDILCQAINNRTILLNMCGEDPEGCPESRINELEILLEQSKPIAEELKKFPPYMAHEFGETIWRAIGTGETMEVF